MKQQNDESTGGQGFLGLYEPIRENHQKLCTELKANEASIVAPPVNITETAGMYKIDFIIPGFTREQIFIETAGDKLLIEAGNQRTPVNDDEYHRKIEYACEYARREVIVPANVDTAFLSAEYKDGILSICMYQTHTKVQNDRAEIAVY